MKRKVVTSRGFSLLEVMVASTIALIVLAVGMWGAAELQRRSTLEESVMGAQNAARAVRELLLNELQRAGSGSGSARMTVGRTMPAMAPDWRYAINVSTNEAFDGNGLFPADATFGPPPVAYKSQMSDAIQMWGWDSEVQDGTGKILPMIQLEQCSGVNLVRDGNTLCTKTDPTLLNNRLVMVVNPSSRTACVMQVTSLTVNAVGASLVTFTPGLPGSPTPATDVCGTPAGAPPAGYDTFWKYDSAKPHFIMPVRSVFLRINWLTGLPVLERMERTSDLSAPEPKWVSLSQDVEMIKIRMGVSSNLTTADSPIWWFPDATALPTPRPTLDSCRPPSVACNALVPADLVSPWVTSVDEPDAYNALMRRLRMVEIVVTTRTANSDPSLVKKVGAGYAADPDGNPLDGYKRRTATIDVVPRNYVYAGVN